MVWVHLLRHDAAASAEGLWDLDEVKLHRAPQNPFFGPATQVRCDQRHHKGRLDHKVTVAAGVEAVCGDAFEIER